MKFITNHQQPLAFFRSHSTVELLKPGETRFASFFIMLQRVQHTKDALQETVMDRQYKQWLGSRKKLSMKDEWKTVSETLIDERFWRSVEELISVCGPNFVSFVTDGRWSSPLRGKGLLANVPD